MNLQPQVTGPEVARFISQHFRQDLSQRPEFEMGFCALRKRENVKLAQMYGLSVDENMRGTKIARLMEAWWMEGKFPPPPTAEDEMAAMRRELAELRGLLSREDEPNPKGLTTTKEIGPDKVPESEEDASELKALDWNELKIKATELGIDTWRRPREDIERDILAKLTG